MYQRPLGTGLRVLFTLKMRKKNKTKQSKTKKFTLVLKDTGDLNLSMSRSKICTFS